MNRACLRCGRIIIMPDIPLPDDYTQRCTACGYENPISDDAPAANLGGLDSTAAPDNSFDNSWSASFDSTVDSLFDPGSRSRQEKRPPQAKAAQPVEKKAQPLAKAPTFPAPAEASAPPLAAAVPQTATSTMDWADRLRAEFDQKLAAMEMRLRYEQPKAAPIAGMESGLARETHDRLEENQVLVCTQTASLIHLCESQLQPMGFQIHPVTAPATALELVANRNFHVIIIDQKFIRGDEGKELLNQMKATRLPIRRCQMVLLITPSIASGESQVFYQWGLDLNIHPRDLDNLGTLLDELIKFRTEVLDTYLAKPMVEYKVSSSTNPIN